MRNLIPAVMTATLASSAFLAPMAWAQRIEHPVNGPVNAGPVGVGVSPVGGNFTAPAGGITIKLEVDESTLEAQIKSGGELADQAGKAAGELDAKGGFILENDYKASAKEAARVLAKAVEAYDQASEDVQKKLKPKLLEAIAKAIPHSIKSLGAKDENSRHDPELDQVEKIMVFSKSDTALLKPYFDDRVKASLAQAILLAGAGKDPTAMLESAREAAPKAELDIDCTVAAVKSAYSKTTTQAPRCGTCGQVLLGGRPGACSASASGYAEKK